MTLNILVLNKQWREADIEFCFSTLKNGGGRPSSFSFSTNGGGDGDGGEDGLSVLVLNERRREAR